MIAQKSLPWLKLTGSNMKKYLFLFFGFSTLSLFIVQHDAQLPQQGSVAENHKSWKDTTSTKVFLITHHKPLKEAKAKNQKLREDNREKFPIVFTEPGGLKELNTNHALPERNTYRGIYARRK